MVEHARQGYSRVIRIDAEVYARLRELAAGFEPPNVVLRRVLGIDPNDENRSESTAVSDAKSDGPGFCHICDQERVTTKQRVRFEDGVESSIAVCEDCLAEGIADRTVVLVTDRQN